MQVFVGFVRSRESAFWRGMLQRNHNGVLRFWGAWALGSWCDTTGGMHLSAPLYSAGERGLFRLVFPYGYKGYGRRIIRHSSVIKNEQLHHNNSTLHSHHHTSSVTISSFNNHPSFCTIWPIKPPIVAIVEQEQQEYQPAFPQYV